MQAVLQFVALTAPLFLLVLIGYGLARWGGWPRPVADGLTRFVFSVAVPTLLFRLMSDFSRVPAVDARLLIAFFGSCFIVFAFARPVAAALFRMNGVEQSVFGMATIFSNNVLLGVPLAKVTLGEASLPSVSLVVVFNSLVLWSLAIVSVEWARHRTPSFAALLSTGARVLANPVVASILAGTAFGLLHVPMPAVIDRTLELVGQAAVPLSLIALGMGLAEFGLRAGAAIASAICALKLLVQPAVVFGIALALRLPPLETQAVVMLASLPVGANVYLMSKEFGALGGPIALSLVLSTALAALTTPIVLALTASAR